MGSLEVFSDILVVGSGIAGLSFALKVADFAQVVLITKKEKTESNTNYAQSGIAAVFSPSDSIEQHVKDTLDCGDGLSKKAVVEKVVREGPQRINELADLGVAFSQDTTGKLDLGMEGGHSRRRIVHAKDLTGKEVESTLLNAVARNPSIRLLENHTAINLVVERNCCQGCYALDTSNSIVRNFVSKITILATGGIGRIYLHTTNPKIATGDGIAMAYRAGATIMNMEFTQFHPTYLYQPSGESFLISEALRGEGAVLRDRGGRQFMGDYHPRKELAPRDIVARAIDQELKKSGDDYVALDISRKDSGFVRSRFPGIYGKCLTFGIDITRNPIPVVPAAHYCCGGVRATLAGQTDVENLLAIGETACTGLHGANRLASNSLLEALVCSHLSAKKCSELLERDPQLHSFPSWESGDAVNIDEAVVITQNRDEIRHLMWNYVGIVRSNKRLIRAKKRITLLKDEINEYYWDFIITTDLIELRNMALVADLIIDSAISRKESRGIHYSLDFPHKSPVVQDTLLKKQSENVAAR
ncbi:MAG: L-aspartate oxidase [Candidatus Bathyarchaeota archaeon]|nr:MAG: L-aspartate oxidase [Candidatus Bathyarchaeota archaeon]